MLPLTHELGLRGAEALSRAFGVDLTGKVQIDRSQKADLQCAAAMQLAKSLKQPPRALAEVLVKALAEHPAVRSTDIAGPGFVNVHLADGWLKDNVGQALSLRQIGVGQTVVIDYSSPNVAKPMHIAHIRSTIIGDAIKRVLRAVGYTVIADNHLGDWGTQFGKLIVAHRKWLDESAFAHSPVQELLRLYIMFTEQEKAQKIAIGKKVDGDADEDDDDAPPLLQEARAELVKLQQGDKENVALWKTFIDVSMREFERVYSRLDVSFDVVLGESFYNDKLANTVQLLLDKGLAEESEGAIVVRFDKARDGEAMAPLIVQKKDGGFLYGTTDIAGMLYRVEHWRASRVIIVTDDRQQLHFRQFFAACRQLGVRTSMEHVFFGLMRLAEGTISTREGNLIGLEALLDEAERRAAVVARECNSELTDSEVLEVGRVVGIGAVKYNDLSKDRTTLVTFTWDKALSLTGNTAPYLQYAYARIQSLMKKAAAAGVVPGALVSFEPTERVLVMTLLAFDDVVEQVALTSRPHALCEYLFELAAQFSTFWSELSVLKAEPEVRPGRLRLAQLTGDVLSSGLDLLGIGVLERM